MSDSIDRRVVEMRFDNTDFEKNVQSTLTVLDKLKQHLSFNKAGKDFESTGLSSAVDNVKSKFSALEVIGVTALANITNSAVNMGKHLAKSLTIDQVKAGFSEYELKMGSIQTIMASTGADLDYVNKKLNELNTYSDKTIYSFSDMTNSIGKFTNAGVSLDTAVAAIQGISNEAAVSGANAQEASRAMYNFAQALSAGYVKLIDWKSIENANMATVEFKQQLIDSAVAAGTLEKQMDGTYKVLTQGGNGGFKDTITATKNFNDSLSAAWMTTEVLTSTLSKYADESTDIGKKAFAAAQDVKTFSQLLDTVKESIGSGWAQTFEIIFGNLEEAKKLWTSVNNVVSGFISASSDARNTILQTWKDLGGREDIANGIKTALGAIHDAYVEVFPPATTKQLEKVGEKIKSLTEGFAEGMKIVAGMKPTFVRIFTAVKDVTDLVKDALSGLFKLLSGGEGQSLITRTLIAFANFVSYIAEGVSALIRFTRATGVFKLLYTILSSISKEAAVIVNNLALFVYKIVGRVEEMGPVLDKAAKAIKSMTDSIDISKLQIADKVILGIRKGITFISNGIAKLITNLNKINLAGIGGLLAGGGVFTGAMKLSKLLDTVTERVEQAKEVTSLKDSIKDTFKALTDSLSALTTAIKATALKSIATAILELAVAMKILASIDKGKLKGVLSAITALFIELGGAIKVMLGITSGSTLKQMFILVRVLSSLSKSLVLMAVAAKILSTIDWEGLGKAVVGIGGMLIEVSAFMKSTSSIDGSSAKSFIGMAASLIIMAKALEMLGNLSVKEIKKGLAAMAGVLAEVAVFSRTMNSSGMASMGFSMILIAGSMLIFEKAMEKIGNLSFKKIEKGLIGIGGALLAVSVAMRIMPNNGAISSGIGILIVAEAMTVLAKAMDAIGKIPIKQLSNALKAMAVALIEMVAALKLANSGVSGAASIFIMAEALKVMAGVMLIFSKMKLGEIGKGLLAMGGALAVLIAAGFLAGKVAVGLLALGGAVALLGTGVLAAGAGVMLMSTGLSLLVGTISVGLPVIMTFLASLITLIPLFLQQLGLGLVKLLDVLSASYESFVKFGVTILTATIEGFIKTLPEFVKLLNVLIDTFSTVILEQLPKIINTGIQVIFAFLDGVTSAMPELVDKAFKLIITFINSMAEAIDKNGDQLKQAFVNLITSIFEFFGVNIKEWWKAGKEFVSNLIEGVKSKKDELVNKVYEIINNTKQKIEDFKERFKEAGRNIMQGLLNGIKEIPIVGSVVKLGGDLISAFKKKLGIASPSKVFKRFGIYISQGLAKGLTAGRKPVVKALNKLISAFNINGTLVAFTKSTRKEIKKWTDAIIQNSVNSLRWGSEAVNEYLEKFTNAKKKADGSFKKGTATYKNAKNAIGELSKELYKNTDAYKESVANVRFYNEAIADEQKKYDKLRKEEKKASKKRKKEIKQEKKEVLKNIKDLNKALKQELKDIAKGPKETYKAYRNELKAMVAGSVSILQASVENYANLFEEMEEVEEVSVDQLLYNMQSQIQGISKWRTDLDQLAKRGIADGLLAKLEEMGPESAKYVQAFMKMTDKELKAANTMFEAEGELTSDTLLRNMRKQMNLVKTWSENIQDLATRGIRYDFLKDLVDQGPDNADYVQALVDMTQDQLNEANRLYISSNKLPTKIADSVLASLAFALENDGVVTEASSSMKTALQQVLDMTFKKPTEAGGEEAEVIDDTVASVQSAGSLIGEALSVGIKQSQPNIQEASKLLGTTALNEFETYFSTSNGTNIAVQIANGLVTGLDSGQEAIANAARALAIAAYTAMQEELDIHSPSRKTEELGKFGVLGFIRGLKAYSLDVTKNSKAIGMRSFEAMRDAISGISDYLDDNITNPVIKPVLDLSEMKKSAGRISGMFDSRYAVGVDGASSGKIQNGTINFTQNNYSPKALSRIDIYRNTKNLISTAKGVVTK